MKKIRFGIGYRSGFSLIEVVIAVGLFAFAAVGIVAMFPMGLRKQNQMANNFAAVQAANQVMAFIDSATNKEAASPILSNTATTNVFGISAFWETNATNANMTNPTNFSTVNSSNWTTGVSEIGMNSLVRVISEPLGGGLYRITFDVSYPAAAAFSNRQVERFSTLVIKQ
jgi:uncharacterized protein (TIGR02598 family)